MTTTNTMPEIMSELTRKVSVIFIVSSCDCCKRCFSNLQLRLCDLLECRTKHWHEIMCPACQVVLSLNLGRIAGGCAAWRSKVQAAVKRLPCLCSLLFYVVNTTLMKSRHECWNVKKAEALLVKDIIHVFVVHLLCPMSPLSTANRLCDGYLAINCSC